MVELYMSRQIHMMTKTCLNDLQLYNWVSDRRGTNAESFRHLRVSLSADVCLCVL